MPERDYDRASVGYNVRIRKFCYVERDPPFARMTFQEVFGLRSNDSSQNVSPNGLSSCPNVTIAKGSLFMIGHLAYNVRHS